MDSNTESEKIKQMLEACPHDIELGNSSESEYDEIEETSHISASDYSESEMSDEEPPPPQQPVQKKARLQTAWFGKDKVTKWEKREHSSTMHTPAHNIYTWQPGPKGLALKAQTPYELWSLFVTQEIVDILVTNTNLYINEERVKYTQKSKARLTNVEEMKALLGLILLTGIFHSNRMNLDDLWNSDGTGVEIFRTTMSLHRFRFLLACLHFDDKVTRHDRRSADKLAPIRDVFEKFVGNCAVNYSHSAHVTIDEMLVGFRGKCPFRQYMPTKPAKYGIKIFALADAETYYVSKMEIYAGKQPAGPYQVNNSPTAVVTRLISPISGTGRNVTMDNWFTSYGLVQDLKKNHNLTVVGAIRKNKREIPGAFLEIKNRPVHDSMFGFQKDVTLVSYIHKKRKHVLLVSSMHHDSKIDPDTGAKKKPEIITFYDKTKGGVNMADQLSALYNTSRNSRRWPLTVFFMLMNISTINSYVIYSHNPQNKLSHRLLIKKIALELIEDYIKKRLELKNLKKELRSKIEGFSCEAGPSMQPPKTGKKHRCNFCERKNDRKVKTTCSKCGMHVCRDHYSVLCFHCQDRESDTEEPD